MNKPVILFIHGFMGNPEEFNLIEELLNINNYQTFSFYLHGHKNQVKKITRKDWLNDCQNNLDCILPNHQEVIVIGHSLGGVLGINLALNNQPYIKKIILIDPSIEYLVNKNGELKILASLKQLIKAIKQIDKKQKEPKPAKLPISAFREFKELLKEERNSIYELNCPILILQGEDDYIVSTAKIKEIYEELDNENKELMIIPRANHWWIREELNKETSEKILSFIKK